MNNYEIISISEDTHEFLLQESKDIFSLAADLLSTSNMIDEFTIERIIHEKIHKRETWRDETLKSEQAVKPSDNDKRLEVLSCTIKYAIVVLHPTKHNDVVTSIKVRCYDNREKPWSECIYCIYNEDSNTYSLLQLSDKFQFDQKESIFNCHHPIIENLLRKFCVDSFKYNEEIQFDDSTDIRAAEISRQDPYESDNLSNLTLPNITYDNSIQSFTTNGNQSLSIVTNEHFSQSAKGNNHQQVSLVVDRYEFRPGQLPSDDRSIYSAVIFLLDRSKSISLQSLYKSVTPTIKYLANMNNFPIQILINNLGLEDILCDITFVFNALSTFYPEILFCIISISNIPETNLYKFNQIDTYPSNSSTHKKCMFILYDTVLNNYIPLYLYDNENNEEAKMNLKYDEFSVPILQQFLLKNFTCPNNLHLHVVQASDDFRVQPATDLLSLGIIGNVNTLSTVAKKSTKTIRENCFPLSRTASATAPVAVSMNNEPNTLVKFVQRKIARDGHCFYSSMILLLELNHMTVRDLRSAVADHVLQSEEMDFEVLCSGTDSNFQEYCYNIKNTNMWADHLEIEAVAQIYNTSIRIVTIEKKDDTISNVSVTETLSGESSFTKCVYLVYIDKNHYEALYLEYDNESNLKTKKVFERNDQTVRELLYEFFKNEYNYHREIKFFHEKKNDVPSVPVRINPSYIIKNPIRKRRIPNENDKQFNKKTTNTEGSVVKCTMEFQRQPMAKFRARMRSDIEPTSKFNKTGQETQLRKPSYMADSDNNHSLTLLIPKELLTHNLDSLHARITIITRYFNERAYEHPYLVFLVCNQQQIIITNPLYIHFGNQSEYHKLTIDTDGSAKLKLFLVIIKRKLCELKQIKSLTVFNPSNSNMKKEEIPVTTTYSDELIKQYELHKLHLCVTLWKQDSNSGEYHRLDDTPCISELIEEDKDFKVSVATQNLYN